MSRTRKALVGVGVALAGVGVTTGGGRELLRRQAAIARARIGKPLGEEAIPADKTWKKKSYAGTPLELLVLGDSIAAGLGAERPKDTLGARIARGLAGELRRPVRLRTAAVVGSETSALAGQLDALPADYLADVAVIVVGGNDVTHRVPVATSAAQLEEAIVRLRAQGTEVVVGTCPDLGALRPVPQPLRSLGSRMSRQLATAQAEVAVRNGAHAVSLARVVGPFFITNPDEMFSLDRFHPSALGYKRTAKALVPSVLLALGHVVDVPFGHRFADAHLTLVSVGAVTAVLLATFDLMPDGEAGGDLLVAALAERGVDARWERWDDPDVAWAAADLVAVRSTWDYHRRLPAFLEWAGRVEESTTLLNGAGVFAWNADKAYLVELADVVPVVPTMLLDDTDLAGGLARALDRWGGVVVKPRTGAGGVGVVVAESVADARLEGLVAGPWIVQPVVESVRTTGESSVFVLDRAPVAQVDKVAAAGELRVHELYGGSSRPVALDPIRARVAADAVRAVEDRTGADLAYARVDLMAWQDQWVVSEVELIEPGLYLDVEPANAGRFADMVCARLNRA